MTIRYITLGDAFPTKSRPTLWRWRRDGKIRKPDIEINGVGYWREDRPLTPSPDEAARDAKTAKTEDA